MHEGLGPAAHQGRTKMPPTNEKASRKKIRESLAAFSNSSLATRLSAPTWLKSRRLPSRTDAGDVVAASVGKACEWKHPRAPTVRLLFRDERATPAVLQFLRDTKVGRVVTLPPRKEEGEWEGLEETELWPEAEKGQGRWSEEGGPGPP